MCVCVVCVHVCVSCLLFVAFTTAGCCYACCMFAYVYPSSPSVLPWIQPVVVCVVCVCVIVSHHPAGWEGRTDTETQIRTWIHTVTYTYTCIYLCIYTWIHTYIHTYIDTHRHIIHKHTYTYTRIDTYTYIHTYVHTSSYMYIHIYIHPYIHIYVRCRHRCVCACVVWCRTSTCVAVGMLLSSRVVLQHDVHVRVVCICMRVCPISCAWEQRDMCCKTSMTYACSCRGRERETQAERDTGRDRDIAETSQRGREGMKRTRWNGELSDLAQLSHARRAHRKTPRVAYRCSSWYNNGRDSVWDVSTHGSTRHECCAVEVRYDLHKFTHVHVLLSPFSSRSLASAQHCQQLISVLPHTSVACTNKLRRERDRCGENRAGEAKRGKEMAMANITTLTCAGTHTCAR